MENNNSVFGKFLDKIEKDTQDNYSKFLDQSYAKFIMQEKRRNVSLDDDEIDMIKSSAYRWFVKKNLDTMPVHIYRDSKEAYIKKSDFDSLIVPGRKEGAIVKWLVENDFKVEKTEQFNNVRYILTIAIDMEKM